MTALGCMVMISASTSCSLVALKRKMFSLEASPILSARLPICSQGNSTAQHTPLRESACTLKEVQLTQLGSADNAITVPGIGNVIYG